MDGEKLFKEINRIDREIKKKNKKISDAIRLEHEKLT